MRIHLKIGKKDADLIYWIESLPTGCFSHYATLILQAEVKKKIALIPVFDQEGLSEKTKEVAIYVYDKQVIAMIEGLPKGKRSQYIKRVVRKHINANYRKNSLKQEEKQTKEEKTIEPKNEQLANNSTEISKPVVEKETSEEDNDFRARMMQMMKR